MFVFQGCVLHLVAALPTWGKGIKNFSNPALALFLELNAADRYCLSNLTPQPDLCELHALTLAFVLQSKRHSQAFAVLLQSLGSVIVLQIERYILVLGVFFRQAERNNPVLSVSIKLNAVACAL
jgi:hypothetical protein